MDFSHLISTMFHDKPGIMYENPPPPSDDFEYNFETIFFTYPRPQNVPDAHFIKVDRSLFNKFLLGGEEKKEEQISTETIKQKENKEGNENIEAIKAIRTEELSDEVSVTKELSEMTIGRSQTLQENLVNNGVADQTKVQCETLQQDEFATFSKKKKYKKHKKRSKEKRSKNDLDDKKNRKKKAIEGSYSMSESDSDYSEKFKTKSSSRHAKSHSKKSSQHKSKDKDPRNNTSYNNVIPYDKVGLRVADFSVKQESISSDEESLNLPFSKKTEITIKEEVLSDKDDYIKEKSSKSSKKKHVDSGKCYDSRSSDDSKNRDESINRFDGARNHIEFTKKYCDYSSDDDSRNRQYNDSNDSSNSFDSYIQRNIKQEIKQEPGSESCYAANDYYCDVCKLILNSETTFSSHMAGKKHKKVLRQLSEQEVAKSTVLEIVESQNFPKPPDMDRFELHKVSKIQDICENADLLIVGLDSVREIRGYEETKYFCDLCSAQCVASSIIKHLIGFKHQTNCLKKYCYRSYSWVKDFEKRDKRVDREIKLRLEEVIRFHGKGRIRVFKDVKKKRRSPEPFNPYQPSTSQSTLLPGNIQGKKDEQKITDEDCLSRDFSDFYCKVCDSHMNNYNMWESHARGKKHAKNKKKLEEGSTTNNYYVEAPQGTISRLEEMIQEQCGPNDIIAGLNFIRENRGENGDMYNCFLCGSVCTTIDIVDHLYLKKHKTKYLEKMLSNGHQNAINEINSLPIGETAREGLVDDECEKLIIELGRGKPSVAITKKTF